METCFVIQPFDGDVYDKRYSEVFHPGIKAAGLEPYRVDRDPGVSVPINDIEAGIRNAQICFAEITTDNPNVWFELGFAIAASKEVVLVCCEDRKSHFPFDVQHRSIIKYRSGSPNDFVELQGKITQRLKALLEKESRISRVSGNISPVKDTEGLAPHEIVALVTVMQNAFMSAGPVAAVFVKSDMNKAGFTDIATALATESLVFKNMLSTETVEDERSGERYRVFRVMRKGQDWLLANQDRLELRKTPDIPF